MCRYTLPGGSTLQICWKYVQMSADLQPLRGMGGRRKPRSRKSIRSSLSAQLELQNYRSTEYMFNCLQISISAVIWMVNLSLGLEIPSDLYYQASRSF